MILLFGAEGQLGRELTHASGAHIVPLVALSHAEVDIADKAAVWDAIKHHDPSMVVNAAAYTKVDLAEKEIAAAQQVNEIGAGIVASACALFGIPLIHISSDYVFDGSKTGAYKEGDPISPINAYGRTKAAGEHAVRSAMAKHIILRTSWVYGEFGQNFLKTMLNLAATRDELRVVADQRGCPTSTADLALAIFAIVPRLAKQEDVWGTYHFAGAGVATWHEFASRIVEAQVPLTGRSPRVTAVSAKDFPTAARRPANSELDCGKFARVFGFRGRPWAEETGRIVRVLAGAKEAHVA